MLEEDSAEVEVPTGKEEASTEVGSFLIVEGARGLRFRPGGLAGLGCRQRGTTGRGAIRADEVGFEGVAHSEVRAEHSAEGER